MAAKLCRFTEAHSIAVTINIFLQHDRISTRRNFAASEDSNGLAFTNCVSKRPACR